MDVHLERIGTDLEGPSKRWNRVLRELRSGAAVGVEANHFLVVVGGDGLGRQWGRLRIGDR